MEYFEQLRTNKHLIRVDTKLTYSTDHASHCRPLLISEATDLLSPLLMSGARIHQKLAPYDLAGLRLIRTVDGNAIGLAQLGSIETTRTRIPKWWLLHSPCSPESLQLANRVACWR